MINELNERSRQIFRQIVEAYVETGAPVGSRFLSKRLDSRLSPASIRNIMSDLEDAGLLYSPHTSAGRLPTEAGFRLFVDGLLQFGDLTAEERAAIEGRCLAGGRDPQQVLTEASNLLSGLSRCAGVVVSPRQDDELRHIEFVLLGPGRGLVVVVYASGHVENRLIDLPLGMPVSALIEATNYLSARLNGRTMAEARDEILREIQARRDQLDDLSSRVIETGLATWSGEGDRATLIVSGRANLLDEVNAVEDLERIRLLFDELENKQEMLRLLELTEGAEGVRIFIGSENRLFARAGCSMIVSPFHDRDQKIVGVIGVIGPTRLNYARIVPLVDYTAHVVSRLVG